MGTHWKEIAVSALVMFIALIAAQVFLFRDTFVWVDIEPFESLPWIRIVFSALTFVTEGALLYYLLFYKLLHFVLVRVLNDRHAYLKTKRAIWGMLMALNFVYVQPIVVRWLNEIASVLYNIIAFVVFLLPAAGITLLLVGVALLVLLRRRAE